MTKNTSVNLGKNATILHNNNKINDETYNYILKIHDDANKAKHEDMPAGIPYLKDATNQLYENNHIGEPLNNYLLQINKHANEAKHHF